ncbi:suppressor of hpr1 [Thecaphora frezii]
MSASPPPPHPTLRTHNATTFSRDLEFLSSLANPFYLHSLASEGHLSRPSFLLYLQHLNYFRHPRYVKYLQYPHALHMLHLLQYQEFRDALKDHAWANEVANRQARHWATWRQPPPMDDDDESANPPNQQDGAASADAKPLQTNGDTAAPTATATPAATATSAAMTTAVSPST